MNTHITYRRTHELDPFSAVLSQNPLQLAIPPVTVPRTAGLPLARTSLTLPKAVDVSGADISGADRDDDDDMSC